MLFRSTIYTGLTISGNINVSGSATSTFSNGINLSGGCFAVNGTCIGGGAGSVTTVGSMSGSSVFADATADDDWFGLGAAAGRIEFDDLTVDEVNILGANVGIGTSTPWALLSVNPDFTLGSGAAFAIGSSTRDIFSITPAGANGGLFNYGSFSTTTIRNNAPYAWTIATSTTAQPMLRFDTVTGSTTIGLPGGDVTIGAIGVASNLVFEESSVIHGQGGNSLTFGQAGDKINFAVNTNFGIASSTPWRALTVSGTVGFDGLTSTSTAGNSLCLSSDKEVTLRVGNTCSAASSLRFKEEVQTLESESGLAEVMALRPVSYYYTDEYIRAFNTDQNWNGERVGFIAEEVLALDPRLVTIDSTGQPDTVRYEHITAILTKAMQEMNLRLENVASTTATTTDDSISFASSFYKTLFARITQWLADATNGIGEFFAGKVRTKELCVSDENGAETCLTKAQLDALLAGAAAAAQNNNNASPAPAPTPDPEPETQSEPGPSPEPLPEGPIENSEQAATEAIDPAPTDPERISETNTETQIEPSPEPEPQVAPEPAPALEMTPTE